MRTNELLSPSLSLSVSPSVQHVHCQFRSANATARLSLSIVVDCRLYNIVYLSIYIMFIYILSGSTHSPVSSSSSMSIGHAQTLGSASVSQTPSCSHTDVPSTHSAPMGTEIKSNHLETPQLNVLLYGVLPYIVMCSGVVSVLR